MNVADILQLMAGMSQHRVGLVEMGDLKLALAPDAKQGSTAASGLVPPSPAVPPVTTQDAIKATNAAQEAANRLADQRLAFAKMQTAQSRKKAASGIGPQTGGLV